MPPKAAALTKSQEDTPPSSPGRRPSAAACPPRRTKRRSSNFKVRAPRAGSARRRGASPTPSTSTRSLRHLRQEFRTGRSQGKLARTPDVTALPQSPSHHQVTKRRGGLIEEESLRPGRRHAPQGRGTHKAIRRHTKSFHISIPTFLGEEGSSLLIYFLFARCNPTFSKYFSRRS